MKKLNMATIDPENTAAMERLNANLSKVDALTQRLVNAVSQRKPYDPGLSGPNQDVFIKAATAYVAEMMANPSKIFEQQIGYWSKSVRHYIAAQEAIARGEAPEDSLGPDPRFANPLWHSHPYFNFLKQQYQLNADAISEAVSGIDHLDPKERKRIDYFARQIVDMFSPTNFLGTNPDALAKAVETDGKSLVMGLENLVRDLEANGGDLLVTLADNGSFKVGENLATTPGKVVFRNRMFELIQYSPTTQTVHETPLVMFPPWINKYYVLDLKPQSSMVKWIVDQGYTLFVVSWVNPDASYADVSLDTYIEEGFVEAVSQAKKICNVDAVNVTGYCIAGTTLSITLALMAQRGDNSIKSATLFTTLTDFADQGEVGVFLSDDFVDGIEREVDKTGVLESFFMSRTFSYLRSNDLIYGPAIKSYMMGQAPPAFDLLYWNGDGTNLPARMAVQYLRDLCQDNRFADGGLDICGTTVRLADVTVPVLAIACETDHIAAWPASYEGVRQMGSKDKTFVLSESGHISGIVNPPSKKKYGHYTNLDFAPHAAAWREGGTFHEGSWWPRWVAWLDQQSGDLVPARTPGDRAEILADAPGTYVFSKTSH